MKCSKCNNEIEEGCAFCPSCGTKVEEVKETEEVKTQEESTEVKTQEVAEEPVVETKEENKDVVKEEVKKEEVKETVNAETPKKEGSKSHKVICFAGKNCKSAF